jgi:hypothetical protein
MKHHDRSSRSRPRPAARGLLFSALLWSGCGPTSNLGDTDATTESVGVTGGMTASSDPSTTHGSVTIDLSTSTSSASTTDPTSTTASPTCPSFICEGDVPAGEECDVFAQECPDGEKCAPTIPDWASAWDSSRCVPVTGTDLPGDPCTSEDVAAGLDSCVKGAMCWGVDMDGNGTCVAQCSGTPDAPICPNNGNCTIAADGFLAICLPECDPLLQDCAEGAACYPVNDGFQCAPDASGDTGKANDLCEFINVCEGGLSCQPPESVGAGCPPRSLGCCTPFCEFPDGPCPNPDQSCVQWFDPAILPEGDPKLDIGFCGVPQ